MKKTKTILLAAALTLGVAAQAQPTVKTLYEGKSVPTEQGWSEWRLDNAINPAAAPLTLDTAGGVLKFTSVNAADQYSQLGWYQLNAGLDLDKGYTIELKAKLNVAKKGSFNIQGYDNSGKGFRVTIADTFLTNQSDPLKASDAIAGELTADNAFHVYRLAVKPSGRVDVYRDGAKIGEFALSTFSFDNIVENGGFEDEGFPDFLSNGILTRIDSTGQADKVYAGKYALEANSNDKVTASDDQEAFRTRPFAIKPNTDYAISITRRRTGAEPYGWRDLGAYYDDQQGVLAAKTTDNVPNITFGGANDVQWLTHSHNFTAPEGKQSVRFEFPSWVRDNTKKTQISSLDNIIFRERIGFGFNNSVPSGISEPVFPEGYVNLIANGDFEDHTINNDGSPYEWVLSNEDENNIPTGDNELWNGDVRIQKNDKTDDELGGQWAHSGTSSLRFSSLGEGNRKIDFAKTLEVGKTYRFNFWHRSPKWDDNGWLKVKLGDNVIWGHALKGRNNVWANADFVFTATEENNVLHLYTEGYGGWFNIYLDDLVLYEVADEVDPQLAGKTNLIANGDFEDATIDNEGNAYTWALASGSANPGDDNYPVAWSDLWGSYVRLQDVQKNEDTGLDWAHSGSKALRFSYLDDRGKARTFEGIADDVPQTILPKTYRINLNFEKTLEAHKTYTFVFWLKAANYTDKGTLNVANGDVTLWKEELSTKYVNWTKHSITFSTTEANRTLRIFSEFGGWFNFYLDDLFLYEEDTYVPYQNDKSYLFFGKSQSTASADVEVEYVKLFTEGAYAPGVEVTVPVTLHYDLSESTDTTIYIEYDVTNAGQALPIPEREYYTFTGWYSNAEFTGEAVDSIPQVATGAKEYWGKWLLTATAFTITYHENGGSEVPDSSFSVEGETVVLPVELTKDGYTFAGWYANAELTGEAVTEIPTGSVGNREFWAKWDAISYTITCHANGVVGITDGVINYTIEDLVALPVSVGYTVSWYANAELEGEAITEVPVGSFGNKELWAGSVAIRYTISYRVNGGVAIPSSEYTIESAAITLPAASREGYTFAGWYNDAELTGEAVTEVPTGSTGDKEFWAKWTKEEETTAVSAVAASALRIYPNPVVSGLLTIDNLPSGSEKVEVYSVSGALAGVYSVSVAGGQAVINISALPSGTYIVKAGGKSAKIVNLRSSEF